MKRNHDMIRSALYTLLTTAITCLSAHAQITPACPNSSVPGSSLCESSCVLCNIDGYTGINNGTSPNGDNICGQIVLQNPNWYGFIAGSSEIGFSITNSNCNYGFGLQAAIFQSCGEDALICNPGTGMSGVPVDIAYFQFEPGRTYYLMIDGFTGDVCNFGIEVTFGSVSPLPPGQPLQPQGPKYICPGATATYSIPAVQNAGYYEWTTPPGSHINGSSSNHIQIPGTAGEQITVTFGLSGGNICVRAGNVCYPVSGSACLSVTNQALPVTVLPDEVLPDYELPYIWEQPPYTTISSPIAVILNSTGLKSYLGCDSTVRQTVKVISSGTSKAFGKVYNDLNNNGVQDPGEPLYLGKVTLQTSNGQTVTSNSFGSYAFAGMSPGDTIRVVSPFPNGIANPPFQIFTTGLDMGVPVDYDFGIYFPPPPSNTAYGIVYNDLNNNGMQDAGESAYTGGVILQKTGGQTTSSDITGQYSFDNMLPGDTIRVTVLPGIATANPAFRVFGGGWPQTYSFGIAKADMASGLIYNDLNDNGIQDPGEQPYTGGILLKSSSGFFSTSDVDGVFEFDGLATGDTIYVIPPLPGVTVHPAFLIFDPNMPDGYDFGLTFPPGNDLSIDLGNFNPFRQGFYTNVYITARNKLPFTTPAATVSVTLPNFLEFVDAIPAPLSTSGGVLNWDLGSLSPYEVRIIHFQVYTALATPNSTPVVIQSSIVPIDNDQIPADNFYSLKSITTGSFDPNDKQVSPRFITPAVLAGGEPLEYVIHFQNTGNFPADFVKVIDTLGNTVDPSTFRFISSSHPCTWKMTGHGVVEFYFENIFLPDSTSDEPASHGFVKFSVAPKKDLPLGTYVENFCDIYFDYNDPVRTNTAETQVVYFVPGEGLVIPNRQLLVRPNPAAFHLFCDWQQPAPADGRIRLFDATGLPRLEAPVEAGDKHLSIDIQLLAPGLYFVVLEAGNVMLANKVVVVNPEKLGTN